MAKPPQRIAWAKTLIRLYSKLRQEYEQHKCHRISKLRKLYCLINIPSKGGLSLSSLSSLSSSESFSSSTDTMEDDETSSENSWAEILGSDWQGRGILGSETSLGSESGLDIPELVSPSHDSDSSSSSGYSVLQTEIRNRGWVERSVGTACVSSGGARWSTVGGWTRLQLHEFGELCLPALLACLSFQIRSLSRGLRELRARVWKLLLIIRLRFYMCIVKYLYI